MALSNKLVGFKKTYKETSLVFHALHFKKRVQLITGANGSGKTTYFKCLSGCMPSDAGFLKTECTLAINGDALPTHLTVVTYLELLRAFEDNRDTLQTLIKHFDLTSFMHRKIGTLSTGMAQRVALAGAFLTTKGILLLDEPMRGLDPYYKAQLVHQVKKCGLKTVIATHEPSAYVSLNCEVHAFETTV